jgi:hypothetical protein
MPSVEGRESHEDGAVDAARMTHSTNVSNVLGKNSSVEPTASVLISGDIPEI